jgi:hypothetical protein
MTTTLALPKTWEAITTAVEARAEKAADFTTKFGALSADTNGKELYINDAANGTSYGLNDLGLSQMARRIGLPAPYTAEMLERGQGDLIVPHVNYWLGQQPQDKDLLVRTLQGGSTGFEARAFLSNKYGILDDREVLESAHEALVNAGLGELAIMEFWQTDRSFHVRFGDKSQAINAAKAAGHTSFLPKGSEDFLFPMLHLSNSEVGLGSTGLQGGVYRVVCANGLVKPFGKGDVQLSKRHFGDTSDLAKYVVEQAEEIVRGSQVFAQQFAASQGLTIDNVDEYLRNLLARNRVTKREEKAIFAELQPDIAPDNTATQYDVVNAITATARELQPDARVALERIASTVLSLN